MKNKLFRMWAGFEWHDIKASFLAIYVGGLFIYFYPLWWQGAPSAENIHHVGPITYWR